MTGAQACDRAGCTAGRSPLRDLPQAEPRAPSPEGRAHVRAFACLVPGAVTAGLLPDQTDPNSAAYDLERDGPYPEAPV